MAAKSIIILCVSFYCLQLQINTSCWSLKKGNCWPSLHRAASEESEWFATTTASSSSWHTSQTEWSCPMTRTAISKGKDPSGRNASRSGSSCSRLWTTSKRGVPHLVSNQAVRCCNFRKTRAPGFMGSQWSCLFFKCIYLNFFPCLFNPGLCPQMILWVAMVQTSTTSLGKSLCLWNRRSRSVHMVRNNQYKDEV